MRTQCMADLDALVAEDKPKLGRPFGALANMQTRRDRLESVTNTQVRHARLEAIAAEMRAYYLSHGRGCAMRAKAIEQRMLRVR